MEVSLTMDIIRLACVAMYDEVASSEGAVLDSLVSDMERDRSAAECSGEIAPAMECGESDCRAITGYCMHYVSLYGQCGAGHVACEAESLFHSDDGRVVVQDGGTRDCSALRECECAHPPIQVVIVVCVSRGCCGHRYYW